MNSKEFSLIIEGVVKEKTHNLYVKDETYNMVL